MNTNLTIEMTKSGAEFGEVIMEQEAWSSGDNRVTYLDIVSAIADSLYETEDADAITCETGSGAYNSTLYIYPTTLSIEADITNGTIGEGIVEEHSVVQDIQFKLTEEQSVKYPILSFESGVWLDKTYDGSGSVVAEPSYVVDGNTIRLSDKVYGTLRTKYTTVRHRYSLLVPAMEDEIENIFQSVAWCRWSGGAQLLELNAPDNAEENAFQENDCKYRSLLKGGKSPESPDPPTVEGADETILIDYCSQQVKEHGN